ncbi:MAG: glycine cleavage system aminomethyltransferase GcvT, partial [Aestuariivirgaceae bacterium]
DVSHMGQAWLKGPDHETTSRALEALVPADIISLSPGQQRYSQLLNDEGGIIDDLMVSRTAIGEFEGWLYLVVNAGRKEVDFAHIRAHLPGGIDLVEKPDWALIALQGPKSEAVLERLLPGTAALSFMSGNAFKCTTDGDTFDVYASRSGYSGEDGYEISVANDNAAALWSALMAEPEVDAVGLGARDSLRLEAGLCLYGHDIDETTSPIEAQLAWSIGKRRRQEGGFPGAERIQRELAEGPARKRVGILPEGRAPVREGSEIVARDGTPLGTVTSGGFGPTVQRPVAMGYVSAEAAAPGTEVDLVVRGKPLAGRVEKMPFITPGYKR